MDTKKLQFHYFIVLLLIVLALTVALFWPFIAALALAAMMAIVVRPIYARLLTAFKGSETVAALSTVLFVLVVIFVPLSVMIEQVSVESYSFYSDARSGGSSGLVEISNYVIHPVQKIFPGFNPDIQGYVSSLSNSLIGNAQGIFTSAASLGLNIFIVIIALFYLLRDGKNFKKALIQFSPLADAYDREIIEKVERAVNAVVRGSLLVSLIRGAITAAGFGLFGVPHAILWGALTAIVSLLPGVGVFLTVIPAMLYLFSVGSDAGAIGLGIWAVVTIGFIDNVLMPVIVGKGFTVHPLFVLLSVVGGVVFFGPVGILLGPLVIALLSALVEIYKLIVVNDQKGATAQLK